MSNVWSLGSSEANRRQSVPTDSPAAADSQQQNHKETAEGGAPNAQKPAVVAGSDSGSSGGSDSEEDDKHGRRGPNAVPGNKSTDLARFNSLSCPLHVCVRACVCPCMCVKHLYLKHNYHIEVMTEQTGIEMTRFGGVSDRASLSFPPVLFF